MADVLLGAMIAGLFGTVGALYSRRREHRRWLRQQRLEAWTEMIRVCGQITIVGGETRRAIKRRDDAAHDGRTEAAARLNREVNERGVDLKEAAHRLSPAIARVELLGPTQAVEAADRLAGAAQNASLASEDDRAALLGVMDDCIDELVSIAGKTLKTY
jgi:hypothetical protein